MRTVSFGSKLRVRAMAFSSEFFQSTLLDDEAGDLLDTSTLLQVREQEGPCISHALRVGCHDREIRADQRREVDFVDDQQIRARDAWTALARNLLATCDIDDSEGEVGGLWAEGRREVVPAGFDEAQLRMRKAPAHLGERCEIHRSIFTDCGVGTAACLNSENTFGRQRLRSRQNELLFLRIDVIGDHEEVVLAPHPLAEGLDERRLSRAHRTTDPYAQGTAQTSTHERNS